MTFSVLVSTSTILSTARLILSYNPCSTCGTHTPQHGRSPPGPRVFHATLGFHVFTCDASTLTSGFTCFPRYLWSSRLRLDSPTLTLVFTCSLSLFQLWPWFSRFSTLTSHKASQTPIWRLRAVRPPSLFSLFTCGVSSVPPFFFFHFHLSTSFHESTRRHHFSLFFSTIFIQISFLFLLKHAYYLFSSSWPLYCSGSTSVTSGCLISTDT